MSDGHVLESWLLDSGASSHMSGDAADFIEYRDLPRPLEITVANGQRLPAVGVGAVRFHLDNGAKVKVVDVLYVPPA
jgi:hypothetical protein